MNGFTELELRAFGAAADTFFDAVPGPGAFWTRSATELGVMPRFRRLVAGLEPEVAADLAKGLRLLDSRAGGLLLYQRPVPFLKLEPEARKQAFRRMAASPVPAARVLYGTLKQITAAMLATALPDGAPGPMWEGISYPAPPAAPPHSERPSLRLTAITRPATLNCDVVVVGSGAGGGVAAAVLAEAGLDVVVLERGQHFQPHDFDWLERGETPEPAYDLQPTADHGIAVYQGKALGGGTLINYSTSLSTPLHVRGEWDDVSGLGNVFSGPGYDASMERVLARLEVNTDHSPCGGRDAVMERGLQARGWHCKPLPRNAVGCTLEDCGYCGLGCRREAKRSTATTWLRDAQRAGARIVTGADVRRVLMRGGRAYGVDATVLVRDRDVPVSVEARAVVVACGAIHSPALLQRSGLVGRGIGRYLRLHPVTVVLGRFPDQHVDPWTGTLQARMSEQFADLDGRGYGFRFETAPLHPTPFTAVMPWDGSWDFKRRLSEYRHWSVVGVLMRDRDHGQIRLGRQGGPSIDYRMSSRDRDHGRTGVLRAAEVLASAGAEEIVAATHRPARWRPGRDGSVSAFAQEVDRAGVGPTRMGWFSFHQMGSLRMGSDPMTSATDGDARVHGVSNLYVMDASLFPTASGVNPMVSIQTLAHVHATGLAARLNRR